MHFCLFPPVNAERLPPEDTQLSTHTALFAYPPRTLRAGQTRLTVLFWKFTVVEATAPAAFRDDSRHTPC